MAKTYGSLRSAISTMTPIQASIHIGNIVADIESKGYSQESPFTVGRIDPEMRQYANEHRIEIASDEIVMSVKQITHTLRESKAQKGKGISGMELYHDKTNNNFIYYDRERNEKFVVHPNYSMKIKRAKGKVVNYITASRTNSQEFTLAKLTRIK